MHQTLAPTAAQRGSVRAGIGVHEADYTVDMDPGNDEYRIREVLQNAHPGLEQGCRIDWAGWLLCLVDRGVHGCSRSI
jgi:hypothetical protein